MPPRVLARRLAAEARAEAERVLGPRRAGRLDGRALCRATGAGSLDELSGEIARRPFPAVVDADGAAAVARLVHGERDRVVAAAERAVERRVDLLGSGDVRLGTQVDWSRDFKSGVRWPPGDARRLDYADLGRPSDVKIPWELSRLQWLIPAGQAYLLTGDERYAAAARDLLGEWIAANPYGRTVNWAVAMEAALRLLTWTYLWHALSSSAAWAEPAFRERALTSLWSHAEFVARNLERAEVNGNHYDADAAGLVFAGLFFPGERAERWQRAGWEILCAELPRQVTPDGVDFEMSTAYHRLVCELFLLPALHRARSGLDVPAWYRERLGSMAAFAAAYTRPDGTSPLWGDADDARALPLGGQALHDHRYLAGVVGLGLGDERALALAAGPRGEAAWLLGAAAAATLPERDDPGAGTVPFPDGGVYVLRGPRDHVFVDCGPVGLAGRGGHGHNDCLSLEAVLDGAAVLTDCGSYVYTASAEWRDAFRSTGFHNTPVVDGEEQNRFVGSLWSLAYDAVPAVRAWRPGPDVDVLVASHAGYRRLADPVVPVRAVALDRRRHALAVLDEFEGRGAHAVAVAYHLPPGVTAAELAPGRWRLEAGAAAFTLSYADAGAWSAVVEDAWVSPSYGVRLPASRIRLARSGPLTRLLVALAPAGTPDDPLAWAEEVLAGA